MQPSRNVHPRHAVLAAVLAVAAFVCPTAHADWINLTGAETSPNIAEIYVMDDHVRVNLEVYVGDLMAFEALVPDDWLGDADIKRPTPAERLRQFARTGIRIVTGSGDTLQPRLELVEPRLRTDRRSPFAGMVNPITRRRVPEPPADKRVLYAELVYPFEGQPEALTISPPVDEEGRPTAGIGFITYHKAVPVIDFRYLGRASTLNLDWSDPWYSRFDNRNLNRHHSSAMMSYLYVEPYEVRHEILVRVKDLDAWMDLGLRGDRYIEVDELEPLRQRIGEFLLGKNPVLVDGEPLRPILDRIDYVKVALTGIQLLEQPERLEQSTAILGVILTYITDGLPQEVTVDWELFTDQIQRVPATSIDPAGPFQSYVTPDDNVATWTNFLKTYRIPEVNQVAVEDGQVGRKIPLLTILLLGLSVPVAWSAWRARSRGGTVRTHAVVLLAVIAGGAAAFPLARVTVPGTGGGELEADPQASVNLLHALLNNVYRAFDFRAEDDVYDKLALTVSGDLLAEIYLQNRRSFAVKRAGGAQAKVKEVEIIDVEAGPPPDGGTGYAFKTRWTAMGTVGHWGHVHRRKNYYDAVVTVEPEADKWKITGLELLEEKRIDPFARGPDDDTAAEGG